MKNDDACVELNQILEASKENVAQLSRSEAEQQLKMLQPELYDVITGIAFDALIDAPEGLSRKANAAVYDAVWGAALVAIEAYRIVQQRAVYRAAMSAWVERLDPKLVTGSGGGGRSVGALARAIQGPVTTSVM